MPRTRQRHYLGGGRFPPRLGGPIPLRDFEGNSWRECLLRSACRLVAREPPRPVFPRPLSGREKDFGVEAAWALGKTLLSVRQRGSLGERFIGRVRFTGSLHPFADVPLRTQGRAALGTSCPGLKGSLRFTFPEGLAAGLGQYVRSYQRRALRPSPHPDLIAESAARP